MVWPLSLLPPPFTLHSPDTRFVVTGRTHLSALAFIVLHRCCLQNEDKTLHQQDYNSLYRDTHFIQPATKPAVSLRYAFI